MEITEEQIEEMALILANVGVVVAQSEVTDADQKQIDTAMIYLGRLQAAINE